jgi:hypothetical protein
MPDFLRITILAIFCLSLTGKVLLKDACADEILPKTQSVQVHDLSDSTDSASQADCGCHCHHSHFDFVFTNNPSNISAQQIQVFAFDFSSSLPLHINSPARPPKIVS